VRNSKSADFGKINKTNRRREKILELGTNVKEKTACQTGRKTLGKNTIMPTPNQGNSFTGTSLK